MKLKDIIPKNNPPMKFYIEDFLYSHIFHEYCYDDVQDLTISDNTAIYGDGDLWFMDLRMHYGRYEIMTIVKERSDEYEKSN